MTCTTLGWFDTEWPRYVYEIPTFPSLSRYVYEIPTFPSLSRYVYKIPTFPSLSRYVYKIPTFPNLSKVCLYNLLFTSLYHITCTQAVEYVCIISFLIYFSECWLLLIVWVNKRAYLLLHKWFSAIIHATILLYKIIARGL